MAEQSYPHPGVDTTEDEFTRMFARLKLSGVADAPGSGALAVTAGTGLQVLVAAGAAFTRGLFYRLPSGDAPFPLAVTAPAAQSRIDTVVVRLDPSADEVRLAILDGTPGAGVAATLTQTEVGVFELPLARFPVAPGATAPGAITDLRSFAGNEPPSWSDASRPSPGRLGVIGWSTSSSRFEYWDGTAYKPVVDADALELEASQISDPQNLNVGKVNGNKWTSAASAPASPAVGDVWVPRP